MQNRTLLTLLTGTAALGLATLGWAQATTPTTDTATTPGSTPTSIGQTTSGTSATGSSTAGRAASLAETDATFLRKAMEGGLDEVQRAQQAMRSAQRDEVRNVASMMLEDHSRSNEKLTQIVNRKGWEMPAAAETAESDQPRTVAGRNADFDDDYLQSEIRHHRETISLYRAQASTGSDPDLRQFATEALPSLEHHLEMLQGPYTTK